MARYLVIDNTSKVINTVELDPATQAGENAWPTPDGCTIQQSDGGNIGDSWPLPTPAAVDPNIAIMQQIYVLEKSVTTRRITDAIAGTENPTGWLANVRSQQATLRATLTK